MITKEKDNDPESRPLRSSGDGDLYMTEHYEVVCDFCSSGAEEYDVINWDALMEEIYSDGWRMDYGGRHSMRHKCPACAEDN